MSTNPNLLSNKPLSTTEIVGSAYQVSKASFSRTLPFYVLIVIATMLMQFINFVEAPPVVTINKNININIGPQTSDQRTLQTSAQTSPVVNVVEEQAYSHPAVQNNLSAGTQLLGFIIWLVLLYAVYAFFSASVFRIQGIIQSQDPGFSASLKVGYRKSIPFIVVGFLYSIAVFIGLLLLIIPGIMVSIYFIFSVYLLVLGSSIFGSFGDSYRLVKGHWWFTTLNIGVLFLLILILGILAAGVIAALTFGVGLIMGGSVGLGIIFSLLSILIFAILLIYIYLYASSYMLVCINDLKLRKSLNPTA